MKYSILVLLAMTSPLAFARLGETRAEMNARFGAPKDVSTRPVTKKITVKLVRWHTRTMTIDAVELDGRMISESYNLMFRPWGDDEARAARETQVATAPEKFLDWREVGVDAWSFRDRATAALGDDGRKLTFRVWNYEAKLNPYARAESI
jgi:hypothetical protein